MTELNVNAQRELETLPTEMGPILKGFMHDLNNMFTCILGSLGAAQDNGRNPPETQAYIEMARDATVKSTQLASLIMRFCNGYDCPREERNIQDLLLDAVDMARAAIRSTIDIQFVERPCVAHVSAIAMTNVFLNTLLNADRSMAGRGSIQVTCDHVGEAITGSSRAGHAVVKVIGEGCGISREQLDLAFRSTPELHQGEHGLGLKMVREIVEQHGGTLEFLSARGKGTTVILRVPLVT